MLKQINIFLAGAITALFVVFVTICISACSYNKLMRVIKAQDVLIERAKSELEYHVGDYSFCDGDEYIEYMEAKKKADIK